MIDELGISGIIDETIPKTRDHILPHSAVIKAMLLNGLGFNERRLYIFSRFFSNLPNKKREEKTLFKIFFVTTITDWFCIRLV
jgi:transposase